MRKGGVHERSRSAVRQQNRLSFQHGLDDEWDEYLELKAEREAEDGESNDSLNSTKNPAKPAGFIFACRAAAGGVSALYECAMH